MKRRLASKGLQMQERGGFKEEEGAPFYPKTVDL